jgi:hypothetical protein
VGTVPVREIDDSEVLTQYGKVDGSEPVFHT